MKASFNTGLLCLRLSIGLMLLLHGIHKIFYGIGFVKTLLTAHELPAFIAYGVYIGEVIAPLLLVAGYKTRIASAIIVFNMSMIIYLKFASSLLQLKETGAWAVELPALFLFGALCLAFTGGGKYSVSVGKWGD